MTHAAGNTNRQETTVMTRDPEYQALLDAATALIHQPRIDIQYGVMRDLRQRGLGIKLEITTTALAQAQTRAAQLERQGMTAFIQQRYVITGSWTRLPSSSVGGTTTSSEEQA